MWFKDRDTYLRFQKMCPDMTNTYDQWVDLAAKQVLALERDMGIVMVKVEAAPEEFATWCEVNSRSHDGRSRAAYAGIKGRESRKIGEN